MEDRNTLNFEALDLEGLQQQLMAEAKSEFIFRENEFESLNFSPSNFISKYRRIDSLESIKEQLQLYCKGLKQELYDIINRDYAEFITIATKLDGVDSRIDHLRKPLINLRLDLASLQDNIVVSVKTIQLKLKQKENINNRKNAIKASLDCMMHVDVADNIINNNPADNNSKEKKTRRDLLHVLKRKKTPSNGICVDKEVFNCAELERAAYGILNATNCLNVMKKSNVAESGSASSSASTSSLIRNLEQRMIKLNELLIVKLKAQLTAIFSNTEKYITSIELSNTIKSDNSHLLTFPVRQYTHCLRAMVVLGKGDILEGIIADLLVVPYVKSTLTQGRIDGSSGRGSFAGLTEALENILKVLKSLLLSVFNATEHVISSTNSAVMPLDIVINSVWKPIMALLSDRFPVMFNTAIANTFKHCYNAYEKFNLSIIDIAGTEWKEAVSSRMKSSQSVKLYDEKWKFDLYYRIRMQEISGRLDKSCILAYQHGLMYNSYALIYKSPTEESKQISVFSAADIQEITKKFQISLFHLPIFNVFCMETCTCVHENITLKPLDMKFFKLSITLINRLEVQLAMLLDIPTSIISRSDISNLQNIAASEVLAYINAANKEKEISNSAKKNTGNSKEPGVVSTTPPPLPVISSDELVLLAVDLYSYEEWMKDSYFKNVYIYLTRHQEAETRQELSLYTVIKDSILFQCNKLQYIRENIWQKICSYISSECKRGLSNVKAIAGRYRMTNKPPPEAASSYVTGILAPYKSFVEKNKDMISAFAPIDQWTPSVINDINANYLLQVQSLMETVVQMETDIKRRLKVTTTTTTMTDSEKIALQLRLDIKAYGNELALMGLSIDGIQTLYDAIVTN